MNGSDAAEAFEHLQEKGIFVIPLGSLSTHSFIVPADLRFHPVPANDLVAGIARMHGLEVTWWKSGITVAILQRGAAKDQVDAAIADLGSASADVRTDAAWRAGWIEDATMLAALVARTADSDRWVSRQAKRGVARLGWPAAVFFAPKESLVLLDPARESGATLSPLAWRMIAETFGAEALPLFRKACDRNLPDAMAALGRVPGDEAIAILEKAIAKTDALELRTQAVVGLGLNGGKKAIAILNKSLAAADLYGDALIALARASKEGALPTVKAGLAQRKPAAYAALGEIGGKDALALCAAALKDRSLDIRRGAVDAIGKIGGSGASAFLAQAFSDPDAEVRVRAARGLGRIGGTAALSALKAAEAQATREVWEQIVLSLGEAGGTEALDFLLSSAEKPRYPGGACAVALGREAGDRAIAKLRDLLANPGAAASAAEALGRIGDRRALGALTDGFSSTDPAVRVGIVTAAGRIGGPRTLPLLALAAQSADSLVVRGAISALQQCGGSGAIDLLDTLRGNWEPGVRRSVAQSLGAIGGAASVQALTVMLTDSDRLVRQEAIAGLVAADLPQSVAPVGHSLGDPVLMYQASTSLGRLGGPEALAIVYNLLETNPRLAVNTASFFEYGEAAPLWAKILTHREPSVREAASRFVSGWPQAAALAASEDPAVRAVAVPFLFPYAEYSFAQDGITALLLDKAADVQRQAVVTLGQTKEPGRSQVLSMAVARDRGSIISAVRRFGSEETSALLAQVGKAGDAAGLIRAVEAHDTAGVKALLAKGANVHTRYTAADHNKAETILMEAASRGYTDLVTLLVENGAAVEAADGLGMTALSYAVLSANGTEPARALLGLGARQQAPVVDSKGTSRTMLFAAVGMGRLDTARLLIEYGADVNTPDWDGITPLMTAARNGRADIAGLLLDKGARIDERSKGRETALMMAVSGGYAAVAKLLLDRGADEAAVDAQGKGILAWAAEAGSMDIVDLLAARAGQGGTAVLLDALQVAARAGRPDMIEALLAKGVTPAWDGMDRADSMVRAAAAGRLDVIIMLQEQGMRIEATDSSATTPLAAAAEQGRIEIVRYLLKKGVRVNAGDSRGWTPLMRAAAAGQVEIITLLLQAGADPYAADKGGSTAFDRAQSQKVKEVLTAWRGTLIEAIKRGDLETVRRVATADNVNVREPTWRTPGWPGKDTRGSSDGVYEVGRTPLMFAAEAGNVEIARLLVQRGARIDDTYERNPETSGQYTADALDLAVLNGSAGVVAFLLDKGLKATDDLLLNACRNGYLEVVKELAAHGASVKATVPESSYGAYDEGYSWSGDAISAAIESGHLEIVDFLRQKGAPLTPHALAAAINTDKPDLAARYLAAGSGANASALLAACYGGYADLVSAILRKGVDADGVGPNGCTPLEAAVLSGKIEIVRILLEHGATVGMKDGQGLTVLEFLEQRGGDDTYAIKTLLEESGKDPGAYSLKSDLTRAVLKKDAAAVQKLLARKPDPGTLIMAEAEPSVQLLNTAPMLIDVACVLESREIVRLLVQNGAAVGAWSPGLRWAAGVGRADLVDLLLSAGEWQEGDAQGRLNTALIHASENGDADLIAQLLAKGADANAQIDRTALMNAAESGSLAAVKALLARGARVNMLCGWKYQGTSALSLAMAGGRQDIVKLLLSSGADGSGFTEDGMTPLTSSIRSGDCDGVASLLKNGADVNRRDSTGETPLLLAVSLGDAALVAAIVDRGADLEARDRAGNTALARSASMPGSEEICLILLRKRARASVLDPKGPTAIDAFMACGTWNDEIAAALAGAYAVEWISDPARDATERFFLALMKRDLAAAAALLAKGVAVDQGGFDGRTPLMGAAAHGDLEVVEFLVGKGADPAREDKNGVNALDAAVRAGRNDAAALLLPFMSAGTHSPKERMLRQAAFGGNAVLVRDLLEQGVSPDATDSDGLAPLYYAAAMGHADIVAMLLERNVIVDRTGSNASNRDTAAVAACKAGHWDVVELLVARGARVKWLDALTGAPRYFRREMTKIFLARAGADEKGENGRGFLVMAANAGDLESVKLLLAGGIKPDAVSWGGMTALGAAVGNDWYTGHPDVARLLVESGAPLSSAAFSGPVLWVAASKGYTDVVKAMLARGVDVNAKAEDGTTALRAAAVADRPLIVKLLAAKGAKSPLSPSELEYLYEEQK